MANEANIWIVNDGPRNVVLQFEGRIDTSDYASTVLVDPAALAGIDNTGLVKAKELAIERIVFNVEPPLAFELWWDATTPIRIGDLTAQGHKEYADFQGLPNQAGAGKTGKILYSSQGWSTGAILSISMVMRLRKVQG